MFYLGGWLLLGNSKVPRADLFAVCRSFKYGLRGHFPL